MVGGKEKEEEKCKEGEEEDINGSEEERKQIYIHLALVLANDGVDPNTGESLISKEVVRVIKTIMLTCGMYDGSGEFAVHVGIPTKSGVGGGLMSVVDKRMGIGIYSPSLDPKGNCIAGRPMLEYLAQEFHLHMFD